MKFGKMLSRIPLLIGIILLICVFWNRSTSYLIRSDYPVFSNLPCDTSADSCFSSEDMDPYKKIEISAKDAPECIFEHDCVDFVCPQNVENCSVTTCSTDSLEEGESCTQVEISDNTEQ